MTGNALIASMWLDKGVDYTRMWDLRQSALAANSETGGGRQKLVHQVHLEIHLKGTTSAEPRGKALSLARRGNKANKANVDPKANVERHSQQSASSCPLKFQPATKAGLVASIDASQVAVAWKPLHFPHGEPLELAKSSLECSIQVTVRGLTSNKTQSRPSVYVEAQGLTYLAVERPTKPSGSTLALQPA